MNSFLKNAKKIVSLDEIVLNISFESFMRNGKKIFMFFCKFPFYLFKFIFFCSVQTVKDRKVNSNFLIENGIEETGFFQNIYKFPYFKALKFLDKIVN